jgi:hypothetical protein
LPNIVLTIICFNSSSPKFGYALLGVEVDDNAISMDKIAATIISSNFWPPIQVL